MSQGPLCPNLTKKFQKEVSQIANHNLSHVILLGGLSVYLNHLKKNPSTNKWTNDLISSSIRVGAQSCVGGNEKAGHKKIRKLGVLIRSGRMN